MAPAPTPLALARYRFTARLEAPLDLPDYAGALLRSVFGAALREAACVTGRPACGGCPVAGRCAYPALFETAPRATQFEQQFSAVPNPYVIEPPSAGARRLAAGDALVFHMTLIGPDTLAQLPLVAFAWQKALAQGLGRERAPARLLAVDAVDVEGQTTPALDLASGRRLPHATAWDAARYAAADGDLAPQTVVLHFDTPLRLQNQGRPLPVQDLAPRTLVSHLLRRINLMLDLHLNLRPAPFDAPVLVALAEQLSDDRSALQWLDWGRYSARQGQTMKLGGVMGPWVLRGDPAVLAPLMPWLALGQWLHVGKNATMGLGGYTLEVGA